MSRRLERLASVAPLRYAEALADLVRATARRSPAPRAMPFFGLDHPPGVGSKLLDRLCDVGIFRVYENVLAFDGGFGGPGRWLARRRGCRVVNALPSRELAKASLILTRRSHLEPQVATIAAGASGLPFADGSFTHAWIVRAVADPREVASLSTEAFRVLRPGGVIAIQHAGEPGATAAGWMAALEGIGFDERRASEVTELREPAASLAAILRVKLVEELGRVLDDRIEEPEGDAEEGSVVHVLGTKPA